MGQWSARPWASACLALALQLWAASAMAQNTVSESAIKAAFLYKFAGFVEWPPATFQGPADPLMIGVLGNDAVASDLEQMVAGRGLDGRRLVARRLRDGESLAGLHVLMLGATRETRLRELARSVPGPVLLVTEQDGGLSTGSVLNFETDEGKVRFSASITSAEARGLRLSARLLAVAQHVEGRR
jgi:hypothetical protein